MEDRSIYKRLTKNEQNIDLIRFFTSFVAFHVLPATVVAEMAKGADLGLLSPRDNSIQQCSILPPVSIINNTNFERIFLGKEFFFLNSDRTAPEVPKGAWVKVPFIPSSRT